MAISERTMQYSVYTNLLRMFEYRGYTVPSQMKIPREHYKPLKTFVLPTESLTVVYHAQNKVTKDAYDSYLKSLEGHRLIIVYATSLTSAVKKLANMSRNIECIEYNKLLYCIMDHKWVPKYELLDPIDHPKEDLSKYPKQLDSDPITKYFNAIPGDIFKIHRDSPRTGTEITYRVVIKS